MNPNFNNLLISGVYYVLIAVLSFFSIFGVYILIRYGKTTPLAITIAVVYSVFFLKVLMESYQTLQRIIS
jgi:hypothetical protein